MPRPRALEAFLGILLIFDPNCLAKKGGLWHPGPLNDNQRRYSYATEWYFLQIVYGKFALHEDNYVGVEFYVAGILI